MHKEWQEKEALVNDEGTPKPTTTLSHATNVYLKTKTTNLNLTSAIDYALC